MRNFLRLAEGVNVANILAELTRQPELWNQHKWRRSFPGTPHGQIDDIWLRYTDVISLGSLDNYSADPGSVWYPEALLLPSTRPLVLNLLRSVEACSLERLLITRLPPGGRILPHADNQGAYVSQPGIARYHVVLQGLPGSLFRCGGETIQMLTGEVWWFNAKLEHEVINNSSDDRIHLLVDTCLWPSV